MGEEWSTLFTLAPVSPESSLGGSLLHMSCHLVWVGLTVLTALSQTMADDCRDATEVNDKAAESRS